MQNRVGEESDEDTPMAAGEGNTRQPSTDSSDLTEGPSVGGLEAGQQSDSSSDDMNIQQDDSR